MPGKCAHRAYQGFPPERREDLAGRFLRWLHPGGFALVDMHNIHDRDPFEGPFIAAGFEKVERWADARPPHKSVVFWHGRG